MKVKLPLTRDQYDDVPEWDDAPPMVDHLQPFPGAQIGIVLPARDQE